MPASISDGELRRILGRMANYDNPNTVRLWFAPSNTSGYGFRVAERGGEIVYPGIAYGIGIGGGAGKNLTTGPVITQAYPAVPDNHALLIAGARIIPSDGRLTANAYRWKAAGASRPAGWRSIGPITVQPARVARLGLLAAEAGEAAAPTPRRPTKAKAGRRPAVKKRRRTPDPPNVPAPAEAADGTPPFRPPMPAMPSDEGFTGAQTAGISGAALVLGGLVAAAIFTGK